MTSFIDRSATGSDRMGQGIEVRRGIVTAAPDGYRSLSDKVPPPCRRALEEKITGHEREWSASCCGAGTS